MNGIFKVANRSEGCTKAFLFHENNCIEEVDISQYKEDDEAHKLFERQDFELYT